MEKDRLRRIKLSAITVGQYRTRDPDPLWVRRFEELYEIGTHIPPMVCCEVGKEVYLLDGETRHLALSCALGPDGEVEVRMVDCASEGERWAFAYTANNANGRPLTERDRANGYKRLLGIGYSSRKAREILEVTEKHTGRWEITWYGKAKDRESPSQSEPTPPRDLPAQQAKATTVEPPNRPEPEPVVAGGAGAKWSESPKRDEPPVSPAENEGAMPPEPPTFRERPSFPLSLLRIHARGLLDFGPADWKCPDTDRELFEDVLTRVKEWLA